MERQSNIELLRLFSIFALLFLHFCVYSIPQSAIYAEQSGFWKYFPQMICSLTTLQVNVFVLISGWFGIRTTPKKIISFYLMCAFYGVLTYGLSLLLPDSSFCIKNMGLSLLPFSFMPGWWFVKAYLFLMLLAPLFNKAIEYMSKQEYIWVLCALTLINGFYGFVCRQSINPSGTNFMQLMYMYFIGRYLALHVSFEKLKLRKWSAICSVIGVGLFAFVWVLNDSCLHLVKSVTFFNNNNPWSVFNSIVIFLFFTTIPFKNRVVNWLSKGVFPVYLIHTSIWLSAYWYRSLSSIYDSYSSGVAWLIITAVCSVYFFSVLCFDHIRILITDPLTMVINKLCMKIPLIRKIC